MKKEIIIGLVLIVQCQLAISQIDSLKFGLKGKIIRSLVNTPTSTSIYYAGLKGEEFGSALIYESEDFGKTWIPLNNGKPISPYASDIQAISIANDSKNSIYAGTWKDGLHKSIDKGKTWERILTIPSSDVRSIRTGIQTLSLVYASTSNFGVIKSIDNGKSWKRNNHKTIARTFQFAWSIELDQRNDSIVFAQTYDKGVWKSTDQGNSWKQILDVKDKVCWDIKVSKKSNSIWVAASKSADTISSINHSENHGETWNEIKNVPQIGISQINVIESNDKNIIIVGSWTNGVFMLKNEKWKKLEKVDFNAISEILLNGNDLLIGSWGNGIYNITL